MIPAHGLSINLGEGIKLMPFELIFAAVGVFLAGLAIGLGIKGRQLHREMIARSKVESELRRIGEMENQLRERDQKLVRAERQVAQLKAIREQEEKSNREKIVLLEDARRRLSDSFRSLAADIFTDTTRQFLELATTRIERMNKVQQNDSDARQKEMSQLLAPLKKSLSSFDGKIKSLQRSNQTAHSGIQQQTEAILDAKKSLHDEAQRMVEFMHPKKTHGHWGLMQLHSAVELTDMLPYCDFFKNDEQGSWRPDLIVRLPGGQRVVIDARVPLEAYNKAANEKNQATRDLLLQQHALNVRKHLATLSRHSYWRQMRPAPAFVVLFLPGESFYAGALQADPDLLGAGAQQKVLLAGPTALIALLHTAAFSWQERQVAENAKHIGDLGKKIYEQMVQMSEHWGAVGKSLRHLVGDYNEAVASMDSGVLDSTRSLGEKMGQDDSKSLASSQIEILPRTPKRASSPVGARAVGGPVGVVTPVIQQSFPNSKKRPS